jgi:hypothetical protein
MSYSARKRDVLCLAVMMLGIAAFAIGAPIFYVLLITATAAAGMIVDQAIVFIKCKNKKDLQNE